MATDSTVRERQSSFPNRIVQGDCIEILRQMPAESVDFILTDPPYLVNYRDRTGRTLQNDCDGNWLKPAMTAAYRILKQDHLMVCFYGWTKIDPSRRGIARASVQWGIWCSASLTAPRRAL